MLEDQNNQMPQDQEREDLLDREIAGKRRGIYLMMGILLIAIVAFAINPDLANMLPGNEGQKNNDKTAGKSESLADNQEEPNKALDNDATESGRTTAVDSAKKEAKLSEYLTLPPNKQVTESMAVLSYPWRDFRESKTLSGGYGNRPALLENAKAADIDRDQYLSINWKWEMPEDKKWLPELAADLTYNISDSNDLLEAAYINDSERQLPLIGADVTWEGVAKVAKAMSTKHLILVSFAVDSDFDPETKTYTHIGGGGWQIWEWSYGAPVTGVALPDVTPWPESGALLRLRTEIAQRLKLLSGKQTSLGTMPESDRYGQMLGKMRAQLADGRFDDASVTFDKIQEAYPKDEASIYALYHATRDLRYSPYDDAVRKLRDNAHDHALEAMYAYVEAGGKNYRLRTLAAANHVFNAPPAELEQRNIYANNLLKGVLKENPLYHEALNQLMKITNYDKDGNPIEGDYFALLKNAQRLHPKDARYYLREAQTLGINADTFSQAIAKAQRAKRMEPWLRDAHFVIGNANLIKADNLRRAREVDTATVKRHYDEAYRQFRSGWRNDKAFVKIWLIVMVKSLAYGRSDPGVSYRPKQGHPEIPNKNSHLFPLYCAARVYNNLFIDDESKYARHVLTTIFRGKRTEYYETLLESEVKRVLAGQPPHSELYNDETGLGAVDDELILLAGVVQRSAKLSGGGAFINPEDRKALMEVISAYRERGMRTPELERQLR